MADGSSWPLDLLPPPWSAGAGAAPEPGSAWPAARSLPGPRTRPSAGRPGRAAAGGSTGPVVRLDPLDPVGRWGAGWLTGGSDPPARLWLLTGGDAAGAGRRGGQCRPRPRPGARRPAWDLRDQPFADAAAKPADPFGSFGPLAPPEPDLGGRSSGGRPARWYRPPRSRSWPGLGLSLQPRRRPGGSRRSPRRPRRPGAAWSAAAATRNHRRPRPGRGQHLPLRWRRRPPRCPRPRRPALAATVAACPGFRRAHRAAR